MSSNIEEIALHKHAEEALKISGFYVLMNRSIPDYRDGFKVCHRRILWAMYKLKAFSNSKPLKYARIVGDVVGKYHPHGDTAVKEAGETLVNASEPLIEGHGEWGDFEEKAGAARYIECRLTKYAENYLLDPDYLACIPMVDTYDGSFEEPVYLPAKLPNLLLNGSEGVATGAKNTIPSFSKKSVIKLVKKGLQGKQITPKLCLSTLEFNFPFGGESVTSENELLEFYKTGIGTISLTPTYTLDKNIISINSFAPRFKIASFFDKILACKEVKDVNDRRQGETILIEVTLKGKTKQERETFFNTTFKKIITTKLPCRVHVNIRQDDGEEVSFKSTSIPEIVNEWLTWRKILEKRVIKRLVNIEKEGFKQQKWLMFAIKHKPVFDKSLKKNDPGAYVKKVLDIEEDQINFIFELRLKRFAKLEIKKIREKALEHKDRIVTLKKEFSNVSKRISKQLK